MKQGSGAATTRNVVEPDGFYRRVGKRALDLVAGAVLLLCSAPLMIVVAAGVLVKLGRPILFLQRRAGRGGRPFTLVKFRTMREACASDRGSDSDAERLDGFGEFLRSTSLDELPELWNVVRGDMSLVGPRPLHVRYNERYTSRQRRRLEIRPGITGLAQVNGRNAIDWERRFELDVDYVDRVGLGLDLGILARTVATVFTRDGISASGRATMSEFTGSSDRSGT